MTAKQVLEFVLIELNKRKAPSLLLSDYVYFLNKAITQYVNRMYNTYDVNQQKTDDLRVLKSTAILNLTKSTNTSGMYKYIYETYLPDDYLHILNCLAELKAIKAHKCYSVNDLYQYPAKRLTADQAHAISVNYYLQPSINSIYYYINNINVTNIFPTTDDQTDVIHTSNTTPVRYGNKSKVKVEIRYGKDDKFQGSKIYVDYLRTPQYVNLTEEEVDEEEDNSQVLEFPDYVCQEILNDLVKLVLENSSDPRLQSNIPINQSIAQIGQK